MSVALHADVLSRLEVEASYLGEGYGHPTAAGEAATRAAEQVGLALDPTYTAKAFAAALEQVARGSFRHVLFWHTLSSAALSPLLANGPEASELPLELRLLAR